MNDDVPDGRDDPTVPLPDRQQHEPGQQTQWLWDGTPPYGAPPGEVPPPPGRTPPRQRLGVGTAALLLVVGAIAGAAVARLAADELHVSVRNGADGSGTSSTTPFGPGTTGSGGTASAVDVAAIARAVSPAVADINVTIGYQQAEAAGTGMVLTSDGEVLTNNHVITGATRISVTDVGNGQTYTARVIGYDRNHDIAVLHLNNASGLRTVAIGDSSKLQVGAAVVAIGNGGGVGGTPSSAGGTVTALGQQITASDDSTGTSQTYTGLIETNADIVPGYSGGPLVDSGRRVIGINTAATAGFRFRYSGTEGFAIPINSAMQIARQIEAGTASPSVHVGATAMLGVSIRTTNSGFGGQTPGAPIADVVPGGPADQAGLGPGDVITSLAGQAVTSPDALTAIMLTEQPGATVTVGYTTPDGQQASTTVRLGSGPPQ